MNVIPATEKHVPDIVELWKEFMDFHKSLDPFYTRTDDAPFERRVRDLISSEDAQVLVALDNDTVVGYSISQINSYPPVFKESTYGYISDVAVRSKSRRKGIGEQMLAKIYEWFDSRDIHRIELRVVANNAIAYSFWKKQGFKAYVHVLYQNR